MLRYKNASASRHPLTHAGDLRGVLRRRGSGSRRHDGDAARWELVMHREAEYFELNLHIGDPIDIVERLLAILRGCSSNGGAMTKRPDDDLLVVQ